MGVTYTTATGATYVPLQTYTLPSAQLSYTFSAISGAYTDLVCVIQATCSIANQSLNLTVNGDTGTNYSWGYIYGSGSASAAGNGNADNRIYIGSMATSTSQPNFVATINFLNYANTTTYKTILSRGSTADYAVLATGGMWRGSTGSAAQAITSITLSASGGGNFIAGSTFSLYGILGA